MVLADQCTPSQAVDQLYRLGALLREHAAAGVLTQRLEQRAVMGPLRAGHPIIYATPLAVAAASGALDQVRALLDAGADPRAQTRIEGRTEHSDSRTAGGDSVLELAINARHYAAALLVAAAIDREWRTWATRLFPTLRCAATPARQLASELATALHRAGQLCEQGPPTSGAADRLKRRNAAMDDVAGAAGPGCAPADDRAARVLQARPRQ